MQPGVRIDYKALRKINPEAARRAVPECLASSGHNIAATARAFGITRPVVHDILAKQRAGVLGDGAKTPHHQPRKTGPAIEQQVVAAKNRTRLGPKRLSLNLAKYEALQLPWATIRNILRRHRHLLTPALPRRRQGTARPFIDWYAAQPFEVVQMDVAHIRDQKALTKAESAHLDHYDIPNYQWGALDLNSRFKLVAYSRECRDPQVNGVLQHHQGAPVMTVALHRAGVPRGGGHTAGRPRG